VIETNIDELAEYLWQREMYIGAHMIKRKQDEEAVPPASTYLAMAVAEPAGRFGVKPMVTGSGPVPSALPASGPWAGDPVGDELPLGFSIEEVGAALGGAGGQYEPPVGNGVEVSVPVQGSAEDRTDGKQR
jgi:hypothetical protein